MGRPRRLRFHLCSTLEMPADDIEVAVFEDRIDVGIAFSKPISSEGRSGGIETKMLFEETLCLAE